MLQPYDNIRNLFPNIAPSFVITSPIDQAYNCIAWAAGDSSRWWWPGGFGGFYWPVAGIVSPTLDAFIQAFSLLGYGFSESIELESNFVKVAIYQDAAGQVKHMARQLPDGIWTSKLGRAWDIRHPTPECLNGNHYGNFACVLSKEIISTELKAG